jgi:hypothetical protein
VARKAVGKARGAARKAKKVTARRGRR